MKIVMEIDAENSVIIKGNDDGTVEVIELRDGCTPSIMEFPNWVGVKSLMDFIIGINCEGK